MKLYRIKKSAIDKKGRGLYATKDIKAGTKVIDYIGKLITKKQTEESDKYDNGKPIYLFLLINTPIIQDLALKQKKVILITY